MIRIAPNRRYCVLAWGLAILVPLLIVAAIAVPWLQRMGELKQSIGQSEDQLLRYRRLIATLPTLRAELAQVKRNDDYKAFYFAASTPALAGAELQRKIQDIVAAAQGRLISTQLLPDEKSEQPARVRLRTQIQGSTETLLQILYAIDGSRPFLFVEQASVRSSARADLPDAMMPGRQFRRPQMDASGELTVRLDIYGFALPGTPGTPETPETIETPETPG
jgi:general secretion pathway protein M